MSTEVSEGAIDPPHLDPLFLGDLDKSVSSYIRSLLAFRDASLLLYISGMLLYVIMSNQPANEPLPVIISTESVTFNHSLLAQLIEGMIGMR